MRVAARDRYTSVALSVCRMTVDLARYPRLTSDRACLESDFTRWIVRKRFDRDKLHNG